MNNKIYKLKQRLEELTDSFNNSMDFLNNNLVVLEKEKAVELFWLLEELIKQISLITKLTEYLIKSEALSFHDRLFYKDSLDTSRKTFMQLRQLQHKLMHN